MSDTPTRAKFSIPSLIAVVAAAASFPVGAFWGLILAAVAICFGLLGLLLAFSDRTRGGFTSLMSILAGIVGIAVAVIKLVVWVF